MDVPRPGVPWVPLMSPGCPIGWGSSPPPPEPGLPPAAAGLYYLAELVEEYTVVTRRIIKYMICVSGGRGALLSLIWGAGMGGDTAVPYLGGLGPGVTLLSHI